MLELRAAYERRPMQMYANYIIFRVRYATSLAANQSYDVVASVEATDCPAGESHFDLSSSRCLSCSAIFTRCSCCRTTVRARARARARERERGGRGEGGGEEEEEGTIWDDWYNRNSDPIYGINSSVYRKFAKRAKGWCRTCVEIAEKFSFGRFITSHTAVDDRVSLSMCKITIGWSVQRTAGAKSGRQRALVSCEPWRWIKSRLGDAACGDGDSCW